MKRKSEGQDLRPIGMYNRVEMGLGLDWRKAETPGALDRGICPWPQVRRRHGDRNAF